MTLRWLCRALCVVTLRAASGQQTDVTEILKRVSTTYGHVKSYEFIGEAKELGKNQTASSHMVYAFRAPDKYRMEGRGLPGMDSDQAALKDVLMVDDGSAVWFYFPLSKQYGFFPVSALSPNAAGDLGDLMPEAVDGFFMDTYRHASDFAPTAKFVQEDPVEIAGKKVSCYVIAMPEFTWWIDKSTFRVLRIDTSESSVFFTAIKLDEPLPDSLFKFVPPPGAQKVETSR